MVRGKGEIAEGKGEWLRRIEMDSERKRWLEDG